MSGQTHQIGIDELRTLGPSAIDKALKDGRLDSLLAGRDPGPPTGDDQHDDDGDQTKQLTKADLDTMTADEIAAALKQGRFDQMLAR